VLTLVASCGGPSAGDPPPGPDVGTALDFRVPRSVLSIPLVDSAGRPRTLADFHGKTLVISDGMTLCQETCPLDTASVVQTARDVERSGQQGEVKFVTITVDPQRDTPRRLSRYRAMFAPPDNWLTLTGTPQNVHRLWKFFGVYWKKVPADRTGPRDWMTGKPLGYDIEHSDEVFFLDGNGHERFLLEGTSHVEHRSQIPRRLYSFLSAKGHHNVAHPSGAAWTVSQALQVIDWLDGQRQRG
jgi:protein SCO1